jgi:hypothetical protein
VAASPSTPGRAGADGKAPAGIKERLLRTWLAYKRLTGLSFPRRFPIVQFPNLPLIVAVLVGEARKLPDGSAHSYPASVSYLAMTIWAYEELVHGINWFRRLPGLAYVISPGRARGRRVARLICVADVT